MRRLEVSQLYVFFLMIPPPPRSTRNDTLFPHATLVRSRDRCAQPLAGTVGGKRGLSMALQQDAIASGRGPAAESEPSLAAAFAVEEAQQGVLVIALEEDAFGRCQDRKSTRLNSSH